MSARAALVCYRQTESGPVSAEFTYWDTACQARQAAAELTPAVLSASVFTVSCDWTAGRTAGDGCRRW